MSQTWILVADDSRARLLAPTSYGNGLDEIAEFQNPEGRHPGAAYAHERPPRAQESVGHARHAIEPHTSAEEKVAERFARELSDALEKGRVENRYERLVLAAPPKFLGTLKHALNKQVRARLVAHLDKDLTVVPAAELHARVAPLLRE